MMKATKENAEALSNAGIGIKSDGTLYLNEGKAKTAASVMFMVYQLPFCLIEYLNLFRAGSKTQIFNFSIKDVKALNCCASLIIYNIFITKIYITG